jgi:hypothetical protein
MVRVIRRSSTRDQLDEAEARFRRAVDIYRAVYSPR